MWACPMLKADLLKGGRQTRRTTRKPRFEQRALRASLQVWNTCANVLILEANDTTPDGHMIPDGPSGLAHIDAIMERLANEQ